MFQENKARQIFRKTNISYPLIRTRTCAYEGERNVRFSENLACFVFLNTHFEIHPFALLSTKYLKVSSTSSQMNEVCSLLLNWRFTLKIIYGSLCEVLLQFCLLGDLIVQENREIMTRTIWTFSPSKIPAKLSINVVCIQKSIRTLSNMLELFYENKF